MASTKATSSSSSSSTDEMGLLLRPDHSLDPAVLAEMAMHSMRDSPYPTPSASRLATLRKKPPRTVKEYFRESVSCLQKGKGKSTHNTDDMFVVWRYGANRWFRNSKQSTRELHLKMSEGERHESEKFCSALFELANLSNNNSSLDPFELKILFLFFGVINKSELRSFVRNDLYEEMKDNVFDSFFSSFVRTELYKKRILHDEAGGISIKTTRSNKFMFNSSKVLPVQSASKPDTVVMSSESFLHACERKLSYFIVKCRPLWAHRPRRDRSMVVWKAMRREIGLSVDSKQPATRK